MNTKSEHPGLPFKEVNKTFETFRKPSEVVPAAPKRWCNRTQPPREVPAVQLQSEYLGVADLNYATTALLAVSAKRWHSVQVRRVFATLTARMDIIPNLCACAAEAQMPNTV